MFGKIVGKALKFFGENVESTLYIITGMISIGNIGICLVLYLIQEGMIKKGDE